LQAQLERDMCRRLLGTEGDFSFAKEEFGILTLSYYNAKRGFISAFATLLFCHRHVAIRGG
jgi:hypothetical protein